MPSVARIPRLDRISGLAMAGGRKLGLCNWKQFWFAVPGRIPVRREINKLVSPVARGLHGLAGWGKTH